MKKLEHLIIWLENNGFTRESRDISRIHKTAVSKASISGLKDWLAGTTDSKLSFNDLFEENLRIVIPFNTKEERALIKMISLLRDDGWMPAGRGGYFNIKKVNQKMRHPGGEEYSEEAEVADLKVVKEIVKTIPAGPRAGEEAAQLKTLSIAKALGSRVSESQLEWWLKVQAEYVKDYNWKQLEAIFHKQADVEGASIIISRDPIDVLRMSDHEGIRSCHSEGDSYFECAVAESRGNGLIAYMVDNVDLNKLLLPEDRPWGIDKDVKSLVVTDPTTIGSLDGKEIFEDRQRGVSGIKPKSRVRLRKYVNAKEDYEFAAPENRTYGPHPPGFVGAVREWAWDAQKWLWPSDHGELMPSGWYSDKGFPPPNEWDLAMHGGSYRDTSDGDILNSFFAEGEFVTSYSGNVETVSDNEKDTYAMWSEEVEEVMTRAQAELKHVSFHAEVGGEMDAPNNEALYVTAYGSLYLEISFTEGRYEEYEDDRSFIELFEHPMGGVIDNIEVDQADDEEGKVGKMALHMTFNCDECRNPDDVSDHFDFMLKEVDATFDEYAEKVRRKLVKEEYIAEIEFDRLDKRLSAHTFQNFNVYGADIDEDGEILISTKPDIFPMLEVPIEFIDRAKKNVSKEDIGLLLDAKPHDKTWHKYILDDKYNHIFIRHLNKINAADGQLYFDFGEDLIPTGKYPEKYGPGQYNVRPLLRELTFSASVPGSSITLGLSLTIKVAESEVDLLHAERFLYNLDKELEHIAPEILKAVEENMDKAVRTKRAQNKEFSDGMVSKPIIDELKGLGQPDVIRLALWVEANWDNFNEAEKEVAYYSFLLPTQRSGDYVHKDSLNAPKHWDSIMQKRQDTDFNYRWKGLSIKDVMPYTDPSAEPGKDPNYGSEGEWVGESGRILPPTVAELERMFTK